MYIRSVMKIAVKRANASLITVAERMQILISDGKKQHVFFLHLFQTNLDFLHFPCSFLEFRSFLHIMVNKSTYFSHRLPHRSR